MKKIIIFLGLLQLFALKAFCQLEGDVLDQTNKAITNAIVIATDSTGKVVDTVKTDQRGFYFFKKLKQGKYKIEGKAPGFQPAIYTIRIEETPKDANDGDDTYYAETLDIILKRPKTTKQ
ncbi:MAG: carboxypeptidase regulatory-like domain-containing protein [Chitinophagaceae bacterium]|nr:carboxypeptidase regulatory-like domain-containing protein [Chitinophagaceae bacterium]